MREYYNFFNRGIFTNFTETNNYGKMKLDFRTDNYWLMHGDAIERMKLIPTGSVDLVLADPPFGTTKCKWDVIIPFEPMWEQIWRILKPNGAVLLFAQTPFDKVLGASMVKHLKYEWIWEKSQATGHLNAKKMPMKAHENVLVFYKKLPTYNPQKTTGHKPVNSYTKYVSTQNNTDLYGKMNKEIKGGVEYVYNIVEVDCNIYPLTITEPSCDSLVNLPNLHLHTQPLSYKVYNLLGEELNDKALPLNRLLIKIYSNGIIEKFIVCVKE